MPTIAMGSLTGFSLSPVCSYDPCSLPGIDFHCCSSWALRLDGGSDNNRFRAGGFGHASTAVLIVEIPNVERNAANSANGHKREEKSENQVHNLNHAVHHRD